MDRSPRIKAILIAGAISGILTALPITGCCCCIWVVGAGVLAAYLYVNAAAQPPTDGEGALVGLGAGLVGGMVYSLLSTIQFLIRGPEQVFREMEMSFQGQNVPPELEESIMQFMQMYQEWGFLLILLGFLFTTIIFAGVSTLGGFIGVRLFRERRFGPPGPPMPPGYGGYPPRNWRPPGQQGGYQGPYGQAPPGQPGPPPDDFGRSGGPGEGGSGAPPAGGEPPSWGGN